MYMTCSKVHDYSDRLNNSILIHQKLTENNQKDFLKSSLENKNNMENDNFNLVIQKNKLQLARLKKCTPSINGIYNFNHAPFVKPDVVCKVKHVCEKNN